MGHSIHDLLAFLCSYNGSFNCVVAYFCNALIYVADGVNEKKLEEEEEETKTKRKKETGGYFSLCYLFKLLIYFMISSV